MLANSRDSGERDEPTRPATVRESPYFPWTRFWCPSGSAINLDFNGYPPDPDSVHAAPISPNLVRFSDISTKRFLVFLGEPGIGKTDTLNSERKAIEEDAVHSGNLIEWIELQHTAV